MASVVLNDPDDPKGTEAVNVTFNADLFQVLTDNVPAGSPLIFGLNYRNDSLEIAQAEIGAAFDYLDQELVMAYELGNEANLYDDYRPPSYGVETYAADMQHWIPELAARGLGHDAKFQFPSFAGPQLFKPDMTIANLVEMGVPQSIPSIEYLAIHGYPWGICTEESAALVDIRNLLNHTETLSLLKQYGGEIVAARALGKDLHMGETGSVACHGKDGVSNTLAAALWELDYALSGSIAGINRFFFHMGKGDFYYSMWEPRPSPKSPIAHINPTYLTMLFVADLVSDLKAPSIAPVSLLEDQDAVHFAIFDGEEIQKLVLLNLGYHGVAGSCGRSYQKIDIAPNLGPCFKARRLTGAHSEVTAAVSWAGQTIDDAGQVIGEQDVEEICDGQITLFASEAVIIERA